MWECPGEMYSSPRQAAADRYVQSAAQTSKFLKFIIKIYW